MILQQQNFTCTNNSILLAGGQIVENQDGSVSLFMPNNRGVLSPVSLSQECCTNLGYSFDIETQTCLWGIGYTCTDNTVFNLVLNPNGNDGAIFSVDNNETCSLNIDFDFLIKVKCETLLDMLYRPNIVVNQDLKYDVLTQIEQQTALCESIDKNITNLNSITCSNIIINGNSLGSSSGGANQFLNNITPGLVENSKALVLDSNRNINTLNNVDVNELLIENAELNI
jgi:hypothetical protein